ncbi:MAG: ABC transporter ATP-binding protein [Acidobacteriota bacterium]|nr:ABC transporter ATP-binding protein [Acidobacteriota bacterium]
MIEAHNLSRRYGDFTAVDRVSFAVEEGEILGILGPNGAGKTTTIRMITGFLPPTEGSVRVAGRDLFDGAEPRGDIGYLPENVALYPEMRVREYLAYRARLQGLTGGSARRAIGEVLERCLLEDVARQIIGTLSKGYRQRVGLATAILHQPRVLVLDEPTVGLDPRQIIAIRELIRELGRRHTLLLSTHILPEVELLCDRLLILDGGRVVDQGTPARLRRRWMGARELRVTLDGAPPEAGEALAALEGVAAAEPLDEERASGEPRQKPTGRWRIHCRPEDGATDGGADPRRQIFELAVARGWVLLELSEQRASLEDVFVRLTTHDTAIRDETTRAEATAGPEEDSAAEEEDPS